MTPRRVKVEGDLFHGRIPDGAVYVGRPAPGLPGSIFGNPFRASPAAGIEARVEAVSMFTHWLDGDLDPQFAPFSQEAVLDALPSLKGKDLACWCPIPEDPRYDLCHGDDLLWRANGWPRPASAAFTIREVR